MSYRDDEKEVDTSGKVKMIDAALWSPMSGKRRRRRQQRALVLLAVSLVVLRLIFVKFPAFYQTPILKHIKLKDSHHHDERRLIPSDSDGSIPKSALGNSFFHLLIPANKADIHLCKTVLSAAVLNYSTPVLINWGQEFEDWTLAAGGSHLAKIPGVLTYLNSLGKEQDGDLVLLVDGYDTWFQLRPDVLLSRYHAINKAANARAVRRFGISRLPEIRQRIVFSTQKLCWPHRPGELACAAMPPSTLPEDVYGDMTDEWYPDMTNPLLHTRQRYLNSGLMMGPVWALRSFFELANARMAEDPHDGSDQGIFSDIIGEQEYQRELLREYQLPLLSRMFGFVYHSILGKNSYSRDRDDLLTWDSDRETMELDGNGTTSEFGVGLDYGSELSHATVFAERDADWFVFDAPRNASRFWHIKSPRVGSIPSDIATSRLPFADMTASVKHPNSEPVNGRRLWSMEESVKLPINKRWQELPLYTHLWTGKVPVSVHHNAWQNNMKKLRTQMWTQMWWWPYARRLLKAHITGPRTPVVIDTHEMGGRVWWSPVESKGGARADNGTFIPWQKLCGDVEWELFGEPRPVKEEENDREEEHKDDGDYRADNAEEQPTEANKQVLDDIEAIKDVLISLKQALNNIDGLTSPSQLNHNDDRRETEEEERRRIEEERRRQEEEQRREIEENSQNGQTAQDESPSSDGNAAQDGEAPIPAGDDTTGQEDEEAELEDIDLENAARLEDDSDLVADFDPSAFPEAENVVDGEEATEGTEGTQGTEAAEAEDDRQEEDQTLDEDDNDPDSNLPDGPQAGFNDFEVTDAQGIETETMDTQEAVGGSSQVAKLDENGDELRRHEIVDLPGREKWEDGIEWEQVADNGFMP